MEFEQKVQKIKELCGWDGGLDIDFYECDALEVVYDGSKIKIGYSSVSDMCRGVALAIMKLREGAESINIRQQPIFDRAGFMLDMSYDGVMTVEGVKRYIDYMASAGLNMLMLYTEDTYEVKKYPQMGYLRGAYTAEELREIDAYASEMGVELIGCIQTLGHAGHIVKWAELSDIAESDSLLLPGEEKTYEFIEECIKTISENISSRRIHVGLDETFGLCEGESRYRQLHGRSDPLEVYTYHVNRVYEICEKYGLKPMMWSDCFFRYSMEKTGYGIQYSATEPIAPEILEKVPSKMDMVYWEYEQTDKKAYTDIIKAHGVFGGDTVMATACWNWDGQLPRWDHAYETQQPALCAAAECGVKTILSTDWQSGGAADYFYTLPSVILYGQHRYGADTDRTAVEALLANNTGMELTAVETMNAYHAKGFDFYGGEKYFRCDTLVNTVGMPEGNPESELAAAANKLRTYKSDKWGAHYEFGALVMEIASVKCGIYNNLRKEYIKGNREYLENMAHRVLPELIEKYRAALRIRKQQWHAVQKPFGIDSVTRLYGGCIADVEYAAERIRDYLNGTIDRIEELEAEVKPFKKASQVVDYTHI